jgi:PKD repeat protein
LKPAALLLVLSLLLVLPVSAGEQYFEIYLSNETPTPNPTTYPTVIYPPSTVTTTQPPASPSQTATAAPSGNPGIADFRCIPLDVKVGEPISCSEIVGSNATLTWYWGDGNYTYSKGGTSNHTYTEPGFYTVIVRHVDGTPAVITTHRKTNYITVVSLPDPTIEPTTEITPAATQTGKTVIIEFGPTVAAMVDRIMRWIELILGVKTGQV